MAKMKAKKKTATKPKTRKYKLKRDLDMQETKGTHQIWGKYVFSEEEKRKISYNLANKTIEKAQLVEEKKAVMSDFKSKIDRVDSEIKNASDHIATGYTHTNYECILFLDRSRKMRIYKSFEDGTIIKEEAFRPEDSQRTFD